MTAISLVKLYRHYVHTNFTLTDSFVPKSDALSVMIDSISTTSLTISWAPVEELRATSYTISYSNTNNTQCFTDSDDITGIAASDTMYTLTDLQESTEYSITVTALLSDEKTERWTLVAATLASGEKFTAI